MPDLLNAWLDKLAKIFQLVDQGLSEPHDMRSALFGLWLLFREAPSQVHTVFEALKEEALTAGALDLATKFGADVKIKVPEVASDFKKQVEFAALVLRALEAALIGLGELKRRPRRSPELRVRFGTQEGWILPFPAMFRSEAKDWPNYFARRGLTRLRFIAESLASGHQVELVLARNAPRESVTCAAYLFRTVSLFDANGKKIDKNITGPFVVGGIHDGPEVGTVSGALELCSVINPTCDIIVFPELSISPERRGELSKLLAERPWDAPMATTPPAVVVAGSWHEEVAGQHFENRARIFDGYGDELGFHAKHIPFTQPKCQEGIEPSNTVLVIATDTLTMALAICLDFCQIGRPNPYDELDVDLVLVPSMGGETTLVAHAAQAQRIWKARKTGTFVVQQAEDHDFGFVCAEPASPGLEFSIKVAEHVAIKRFSKKD